MNTLDGIYTTDELAKMWATAQHLANLARDMTSMLIYCDRPEWHAQSHQNGIQAAFSELHAVVLGLEGCDIDGLHGEGDSAGLSGKLYDRGDMKDFVPD